MDASKLKQWFEQHLNEYRSDPELGSAWKSYLFEDGFGECGGDWNSEADKDAAESILREIVR